MHTTENILVIGATGKTGRRIVERLEARGRPVRGASRRSDPPFDWDDRSTWRPALEGATAAYISYFPDIAIEGSTDAIAELVAIALEVGCRRLVLLSGRGEVEAERAERVLQGSGADWTVLRCSWFMQNFSEGEFAALIAEGELAVPGGDVRTPFVDTDDIADVAVAALTEPGHVGQVYELSGPDSLTHAEVAAEITRATGREVRYVPLTVEEFTANAAELIAQPEFVELLRYLFTEVLVEENSSVTDGVQRALGRPARSFADFARDAAWKVTA
jgi:uncharacterized protein YbjT (DUF2867 family)